MKKTNKLPHGWSHGLSRYAEGYRNSFKSWDLSKEYNILEIGVSLGGGMLALRKAFPNSFICGIDVGDCRENNLIHNGEWFDEKMKFMRGDQSDTKFLNSVIDVYKKFDIIIDDGSHVNEHQRITFEHLFPFLSPSSPYIVEDVHTSYWERQFGGGLKNENSFIEYSKTLVDSIHEWCYTEPFTLLYGDKTLPRTKIPSSVKHWVESVNFYVSMVVINKKEKRFENQNTSSYGQI